MSQKEQYEFVCKRCFHTSIFESEPPKDYEGEICGPPPKTEHGKFSKNYTVQKPPRWWRCGNHNVTMKWGDSCIECSKKFTQRNFPTADWTMVPNLNDQNTKDEIKMSKTETTMRNKVIEKQQDYVQATLNTPVLLKQLIRKMDKLAKVMEDKNEKV